MKVRTLANIRYTKLKEGVEVETTDRVVIPTYIPAPSMKAIDVTDLNDEDREELLQQLQEYADYVELKTKTVFNFEDWLDMTNQRAVTDQIKWRTFKMDQIS